MFSNHFQFCVRRQLLVKRVIHLQALMSSWVILKEKEAVKILLTKVEESKTLWSCQAVVKLAVYC